MREKLDADLEEVELDHERKHYEAGRPAEFGVGGEGGRLLASLVAIHGLSVEAVPFFFRWTPRSMIRKRWRANSTCKPW